MHFYSMAILIFKRIKSDIPLLITGSLLFYYLFKNELDMLNSYAENELLPHITNDLNENINTDLLLPIDNEFVKNSESTAKPVINTNPDLESLNLKTDKSKDSTTVNLFDYDTLLEKNRFFPILQNSLDTSDVFNMISITPSNTIKNIKSLSRKLKHLIVDKFTWKTSYTYISEDYPNIQSIKFIDNGFEVKGQLTKIKSLFQETFDLYSNVIAGETDELKPLTRERIDNGNGFGRTLIGSIDMFFLLNMEQELDDLVQKLTIQESLSTTKNLLNTNENFITIVSSLISGYELSNEKDEIFLKIAKQMAKIAIKAYDSPINGLPLPELPFKSLIQNRFPLRRTSIFDITGNILELVKMSSLTKENVYISTGLNVFQKMHDSSKNVFNMDYLFPSVIDPSGCQLVKQDANRKVSATASQSHMKSIFNGNYVSCLQRTTFFSINDINNFDSDGEEILEFIDLINEDGNVNYLFSILKTYHLLNGNDDLGFKAYFEKSFEIINKFMFYKPNLPANFLVEGGNNDFVFFTPITVKKGKLDEINNELDILVTQSLKFRSQHCQLGGMFLYASKLFENKTYQVIGEQLINGCVLLPKFAELELIPESASFDKCFDLNNCYSFNKEAKIQSMVDGSIFDNNFEIVTDGFFKIADTELPDTFEDNEVDAELMKLKDSSPLIKVDRKRNNKDLIDLKLEYEDEDETSAEIETSEGDILSDLYTKQQQQIEEEEQEVLINKIFKMTTSKVEIHGKPFNAQLQKWTDGKYPFYINSLDSKYLLRPEFIESLFYAYRITGDNKYRSIAAETLDKLIAHVKQVHNKHIEISALEDLYTLEPRDELPYYWFTRTLKYYYLIFSDVSKYSLDDYIFNGDGHIFKKNYIIQN